MDPDIQKYRKLEKYLNSIEFKEIKIGSLLAQTFELNYYNPRKNILKNSLRIIKYLLFLFFPKKAVTLTSDFIFTKVIGRFHFNELMDPLILHFLKNSIIVSEPASFDPVLHQKYPLKDHLIHFKSTINNNRKDIFPIILTLLKAIRILIKNRKRLQINLGELIFFFSQLILQLRSVSFWMDHFERMKIKPLCVITEFDRISEASAIVLTAKQYNIKTITLTHGVIGDYGFTPLLADYIFCWGNYQKRQLLSQGVPPHRIRITGNPMIKKYSEKSNGLPHRLNICLALSPDNEFINKSMIDIFSCALQKTKQLRGTIKLHPSLRKEKYENYLTETDRIEIKDSQEISNIELFEQIDLMIIRQSGIANEALAAGVPVIIMEPKGSLSLNDLQKQMVKYGFKVISNCNDLVFTFDELLSNPELFKNQAKELRLNYLNDVFGLIGQESVRSMISNIEDIVN